MENKTKIASFDPTPFKEGYSEKTKKNWAMFNAVTESGLKVTTFEVMKPGDEVVVTEKEYTKKDGTIGTAYNASKPRKPIVDLEPVLKGLREVYKQNTRIEAKLDKLLNMDEPTTAQNPEPTNRNIKINTDGTVSPIDTSKSSSYTTKPPSWEAQRAKFGERMNGKQYDKATENEPYKEDPELSSLMDSFGQEVNNEMPEDFLM